MPTSSSKAERHWYANGYRKLPACCLVPGKPRQRLRAAVSGIHQPTSLPGFSRPAARRDSLRALACQAVERPSVANRFGCMGSSTRGMDDRPLAHPRQTLRVCRRSAVQRGKRTASAKLLVDSRPIGWLGPHAAVALSHPFFTPTALYSTAQGRRAAAHPGTTANRAHENPNGVLQMHDARIPIVRATRTRP